MRCAVPGRFRGGLAVALALVAFVAAFAVGSACHRATVPAGQAGHVGHVAAMGPADAPRLDAADPAGFAGGLIACCAVLTGAALLWLVVRRLARPRARRLPRARVRARAVPAPRGPPRRTALTLVELSILRT